MKGLKKTTHTLIISLVFTLSSYAQSWVGAWQHTLENHDDSLHTTVLIVTEHYLVSTTYDKNSGAFIKTRGGAWKQNANETINLTLEFDSENPDTVGTQDDFNIMMNKETLIFLDDNVKFQRLDDGGPGILNGAWLMSARMKDGTLQQRNTNKARKTMKILSGSRFQWIAYNTETKTYMATGGGTYTTIDERYTETIEFFSKDPSKVGLQLEFSYQLIDGNWQHTGKSSKGDPTHEVWSLRKSL